MGYLLPVSPYSQYTTDRLSELASEDDLGVSLPAGSGRGWATGGASLPRPIRRAAPAAAGGRGVVPFEGSWAAREVNQCSDGWRVYLSSGLSSVAVVRRVSYAAARVGGGRRGEVREFTWASRRNMMMTLSRLTWHPEAMHVLSLPDDWSAFCDGRLFKKILHSWLVSARRYIGRVFWFLEFQGRGAPHVHVLTERMPSAALQLRMARTWARLICKYSYQPPEAFDKIVSVHTYSHEGYSGSGRNRSAWQTERKDRGFVRYATKYAFKMEQKRVPDCMRSVGRFWGYTGDLADWSALACTSSQWADALLYIHTEGACLSNVPYLKQVTGVWRDRSDGGRQWVQSARGFLWLSSDNPTLRRVILEVGGAIARDWFEAGGFWSERRWGVPDPEPF